MAIHGKEGAIVVLRINEELIAEGNNTVSLEENKVIVRKAIEALNRQDLSLLDDFFSPDYVVHTYQIRGLDEFKQYYARLYKGFPDWHETIEDLIAEGDKVCVRLTINTGIHTGEFRGIAPTGKKSTHKAIQIWQIIDGRVMKKESIYDQLDFLKQLGIIEITEKGKQLFPEEK